MSGLGDVGVEENVDSPDKPEGELHDPWKDDPSAMSPFGGWFCITFEWLVLQLILWAIFSDSGSKFLNKSSGRVPVKRLIMLTRNNAELTFEPQFAPPQCILWAIFGGFPGFLRVPGKPTEK